MLKSLRGFLKIGFQLAMSACFMAMIVLSARAADKIDVPDDVEANLLVVPDDTEAKKIDEPTTLTGKGPQLAGCRRSPFPGCVDRYHQGDYWKVSNYCSGTIGYHIDIAGGRDSVGSIPPGY